MAPAATPLARAPAEHRRTQKARDGAGRLPTINNAVGTSSAGHPDRLWAASDLNGPSAADRNLPDMKSAKEGGFRIYACTRMPGLAPPGRGRPCRATAEAARDCFFDQSSGLMRPFFESAGGAAGARDPLLAAWCPSRTFGSSLGFVRSMLAGLAAVGRKLQPKFRVVTKADAPAWDSLLVALAEHIQLPATEANKAILSDAMLVLYPLRFGHDDAAARVKAASTWDSSPCVFLKGGRPSVGAGAASAYPDPSQRMRSKEDYMSKAGAKVPCASTSTDSDAAHCTVTTSKGKATYSTIRLAPKLRLGVHRFLLCARAGPPPLSQTMHAMHLCDQKACVNPTHLIWGTAGDNAKGHGVAEATRQQRGPCGYAHVLGEAAAGTAVEADTGVDSAGLDGSDVESAHEVEAAAPVAATMVGAATVEGEATAAEVAEAELAAAAEA